MPGLTRHPVNRIFPLLVLPLIYSDDASKTAQITRLVYQRATESLISRAFRTRNKVLIRGLPPLDNDRYRFCLPSPEDLATLIMPLARATSPTALTKKSGSPSSSAALRYSIIASSLSRKSTTSKFLIFINTPEALSAFDVHVVCVPYKGHYIRELHQPQNPGIWGQSKNIWIKPATSDNVSIFTLTPKIDEIRKDRYERV